MRVQKKWLSLLLAGDLLVGCASPTVVRPVLLTDGSLSCTQLEREMGEADRVRNDATKEKGVTSTNAMAALFFWPAIFATYNNVNEAVAAADQRKLHLASLHREKQCHIASPSKPTTAPIGNHKTSLVTDLLDVEFRKDYPPTQFAVLTNVEAVPYIGKICKDRYSEFLNRAAPKGFAVSVDGRCGFSWGVRPPLPELPTDPAKRALLACQRVAKSPCHLYVLDNDVVWRSH